MSSARSLKIGGKLVLAFAALILIILTISIFAIDRLGRVEDAAAEMRENRVPSLTTITRMDVAALEHRISVAGHIISQDAAAMARMERQIDQYATMMAEAIGAYRPLISDDAERAAVDRLASGWEQYLEVTKRLLTVSRENRTGEAMALYEGEAR